MAEPISRLQKLRSLGQSPWYDNIDRRLIESGELKGLFDRGIVGVTSNPTIFEKAIAASCVYDAKIRELKQKGLSLEEIFEDISADDVRDAADLLKGVYEKTGGLDGYVSIEVLPAYAHDAAKTVVYARHIFGKVGRPNVMVKVPGTSESPAAIRTLIQEGINVNATLIFSQGQYEAAATAYWNGLNDAAREGRDISRIASVASIFVSRIDTKIDNLLDTFAVREHKTEARQAFNILKGKTGIANAKMIYQRYKDLFGEVKFGELKGRGGRPQRVLWASTGTKNPQYSDCLYVDNLIGPMTVNTMPHATVLAFEDHGRISLRLEQDLDQARRVLEQIEEMGISVQMICDEAEAEGIVAFQRSYETLVKTLAAKVAGV